MVSSKQLFLLAYVTTISVAAIAWQSHFLTIYYAASMTVAVYISITVLLEDQSHPAKIGDSPRKDADAPWSIRIFTWALEKLSYKTETTS